MTCKWKGVVAGSRSGKILGAKRTPFSANSATPEFHMLVRSFFAEPCGVDFSESRRWGCSFTDARTSVEVRSAGRFDLYGETVRSKPIEMQKQLKQANQEGETVRSKTIKRERRFGARQSRRMSSSPRIL